VRREFSFNAFYLALIAIICLGVTVPVTSHAFEICIFGIGFCETPEQRDARLQQEAIEKAAEEAFQEFLDESHLGILQTYSYTTAELAQDFQLGWKLILVVNRSEDPAIGQTLMIYLDGMPYRYWNVSTALEGKKHNKRLHKDVDVTTRLGRYTIDDMYHSWHSREWDEDLTEMIFYGPREVGVGFHAAQNHKADLAVGTRYSAGCTHLHPADASELYNLVSQYRKQTLVIIQETSSQDPQHLPTDLDLKMLLSSGAL